MQVNLHETWHIRTVEIPSRLVLAPMAGVSVQAFRRQGRRFGAGLVCSEMVSCAGLQHGNERTLGYLRIASDERPLAVQIFGSDPAVMAEAARMVEDAGADIVDINFGCPVKKVTKTGAGATLLDDPDRACRVVEAVASAVSVPVTVKLRRELVSLVDVPVVASGDIVSRAQAQAVLATTRAAAVMVGRAAQGNPWALREILEGDRPEPSREEVVAELILFMRETVRELGEHRATGFLKKFYGWYLGHGRFPRAFKAELTQLPTIAEVESRLLAAAPGARFVLARLEETLPQGDEVLLDLPISIYGGG
ncbi:MAG: hypothetical protein E6G25_09395 [Actinobacteria bacterium]|nr:MAG: hypothetical protein E6G25_09395 [Actinomycetota bacterium]